MIASANGLGRYVVSPDGRIVFHENSQRTKPGWRDAEQADMDAAPMDQLVKCGYVAGVAVEVAPIALLIPTSIKATGTVADAPTEAAALEILAKNVAEAAKE